MCVSVCVCCEVGVRVCVGVGACTRVCLHACLHAAFYQFVGCTAPALQAVEFDVVYKENLVWVCMQ